MLPYSCTMACKQCPLFGNSLVLLEFSSASRMLPPDWFGVIFMRFGGWFQVPMLHLITDSSCSWNASSLNGSSLSRTKTLFFEMYTRSEMFHISTWIFYWLQPSPLWTRPVYYMGCLLVWVPHFSLQISPSLLLTSLLRSLHSILERLHFQDLSGAYREEISLFVWAV